MRALGTVYEEVRSRIVELVAPLGDDATTIKVPACPEWSVHDVIAHLAGICADVMTGNVAGAATPAWTGAQVDARKQRTTTELLKEWDELGPQVAALTDDFPGRLGWQFTSDITVHEQDLRGALGRPGERCSEAVGLALDFLVTVFVDTGVRVLGLGPLEIRADGRTWLAGTGGPPEPDADADEALTAALLASGGASAPTAAPVGTLTVEPFELFRAASGRRSAEQVRRFEWTVDPDPYLPAFAFGPFTMSLEDLSE